MMKKYFLYLAMASMALTSLTACSSDNDGEGPSSSTSTLPTPKYAAAAQRVNFSQPIAATTLVDGAELLLNGFELSEDGFVFLEILKRQPDETTSSVKTEVIYDKEDLKSYDGRNLILKDNKGEINMLEPTRATSTKVVVSVYLNIVLPNIGAVTFSTDDETVEAQQKTEPQSGNTMRSNLCRTWKVLGTIIDLEGDVNVFKEFKGGNLKALCDEAVRQGADLTAEEQARFNKVVESITLTNAGLIVIEYTDGTVDAGDFQWANAQYDSFKIMLKDEGMGNKFLANNTVVTSEFRGDRCNLKCTTDIRGSKNFKAAMTLQLQALN